MPSLRRTLSSPSVRSSPYPTALSSSIGSGRANGHGNRRSSGSETSTRRVLADIEWWRVVDGQTELESEERGPDQEQGNHVTDDTRGAEHPLMPLALTGVTLHVPQSPHSSEAFNLPTSQFAALSITPSTPRRHDHVLESSFPVGSTPEAIKAPLDGLRLSFADLDTEYLPGLLTATRDSKPSTVRAHSFTGFALLQGDIMYPTGGYANFSISPLSSHPRDLFN